MVEARQLSNRIKEGKSADIARGTSKMEDGDQIMQSLDALGYDEAAQYVYGMANGDWKKRHAKKASDEQMERYNQSQPMWASHDKEVLAKRTEDPGKKMGNVSVITTQPALSNVCCQDVEDATTTVIAPIVENKVKVEAANASASRQLPPYTPPSPPAVSITLGVLTVSDRASAGEYTSGDLSGPAVQRAVEAALETYKSKVVLTAIEVGTVPDESDLIESKLREWADDKKLDLIFTTGGTGFSPRDVTPEATHAVVNKVCEGLVSFCTMQCSKLQPLASLSRGTAGVRGKTLIANLPGNPRGVDEIIPILLPLALHAVADIKATQ